MKGGALNGVWKYGAGWMDRAGVRGWTVEGGEGICRKLQRPEQEIDGGERIGGEGCRDREGGEEDGGPDGEQEGTQDIGGMEVNGMKQVEG